MKTTKNGLSNSCYHLSFNERLTLLEQYFDKQNLVYYPKNEKQHFVLRLTSLLQLINSTSIKRSRKNPKEKEPRSDNQVQTVN